MSSLSHAAGSVAPLARQGEDRARTKSQTAKSSEDQGWRGLTRRDRSIAFLTSLVVHAACLILLFLLTTVVRGGAAVAPLLVANGDLDSNEFDSASLLSSSVENGAADANVTSMAVASSAVTIPTELIETATESTRIVSTTIPEIGLEAPESAGERVETIVEIGQMLDGRESRGQGKTGGGPGASPETEAAVERGLRWLARHQLADGSWHFDHTTGECDRQCPNPGGHVSTTGATGLALMAFLGAGNTHKKGPYKKAVNDGLYYLSQRMIVTPAGGDLTESTMYAQGIAAIALCEAYAMTKDPVLKHTAQLSLDFIVSAQDTEGGGWRYRPLQPGDTTVTGWQLMALKSGQMAYLDVPDRTIDGVKKFLDSVQVSRKTLKFLGVKGYRIDGAGYKYTPNRAEVPNLRDQMLTMSAMGQLMRMYTGWRRNNEALIAGVSMVARQGPRPNDMYFNYYATQVMHHWGGETWQLWDDRMRPLLLSTQTLGGHADGSWYFPNRHTDQGGRLCGTALATMTLEVYYRHMPIYGQQAIDDEF